MQSSLVYIISSSIIARWIGLEKRGRECKKKGVANDYN
jgi:hypothetical protein